MINQLNTVVKAQEDEINRLKVSFTTWYFYWLQISLSSDRLTHLVYFFTWGFLIFCLELNSRHTYLRNLSSSALATMAVALCLIHNIDLSWYLDMSEHQENVTSRTVGAYHQINE